MEKTVTVLKNSSLGRSEYAYVLILSVFSNYYNQKGIITEYDFKTGLCKVLLEGKQKSLLFCYRELLPVNYLLPEYKF